MTSPFIYYIFIAFVDVLNTNKMVTKILQKNGHQNFTKKIGILGPPPIQE